MTAPPILAPGEILADRFEIAAEIGMGSYGRVYRARQLSTGQDVAIKLLRLEDRSPAEHENLIARFRREMRVCAALSHPNIVRLLDYGEREDGLLWTAFEYVPGQTLREVLEAEGALPLAETVHLMTQVLDAVSAAHAAGIVHRDVKPENVMVARSGVRRNALVLDFGLGGLDEGRADPSWTRLTGPREMMGTPSYAAPELLRGEPATPRSDLYSWGLVFLECLTGEGAVTGRTGADVLLMQLGPDPIPIPESLRGTRTGRLLDAVTAKDVRQRDVTVAGLLAGLEVVARDAATNTRPAATATLPARRPLTLVCLEVAIFGRDETALDLEDVDRISQTVHDRVGRAATDDRAVVVRALGHQILLAFGHPRVRENDARRAVRTALRLGRELADLASDTAQIDVRVGIHSGLAMLREGAGPGAAYDVVGDVPAIATRLADRARAGEVLLTVDTRGLLRDEVACLPAGNLDVPGRSGAIGIFRARHGPPPGARETIVRQVETPLVGRRKELSQLTALWSDVRAGEAGTVVVRGEPGIGKSRLVRELRSSVPWSSWLECRCTPEAQQSPLSPVAELLRRSPERIDRLLVRHGFDLQETLPVLTALLGVDLDARPAGPPPSPERQKELTLSTLVALLLRIARVQPTILVVEDLHWSDPTTLEMLGRLVGELTAQRATSPDAQSSLGVVATCRPEHDPGWAGDGATVLSLGHLARSDVATMVRALWSGEPDAVAELVDRIATRTDGIPFFVEELTAAIAHTDAVSSAERIIPVSLREILAARLDALSPSARSTVQVAACLGRHVSLPLLEAVADKDEWIVRQDLVELVDARLLYARRDAADDDYVFRHSLVRDAAYDALARGTRRHIHRAIAEALTTILPRVAESRPELVAHHLTAGGDAALAIEYWGRAADRAIRRAAYTEAIANLEAGLSALAALPEGPERDGHEIELLIMLGTAHFSTKGNAAPEVIEAFGRARALSERLGVEVSLKILSGMFSHSMMRGDRDAIESLLPRFEILAERRSDVVAELTGLTGLLISAFYRGDHAAAAAWCDRARPLWVTETFRRYAEEYGWDGGVFSWSYSVWNDALMGRMRRAEAIYGEMMERVASSFDPAALPTALVFGMVAAQARRDPEETRARSERLVTLGTEQHMLFMVALGECGLGAALAQAGRPADGIAHVQQGLAVMELAGCTAPLAYYHAFLADAQLAAEAIDDGLATVERGLALTTSNYGRVQEPELHRLGGRLLQCAGRLDEAEERLRRAVGLAGTRGARTWELRAAVDLAELLVARERRSEAATLLQPVVAAFGEERTLPDLEAAARLLAACARAHPHG